MSKNFVKLWHLENILIFEMIVCKHYIG
jgi:hypothetical protein